MGRQRQLGVLEHGVGGQRDLPLAADALEDLAGVQLAVLVLAAGGAAEALRPARLEHRLGALQLGSVELEEVAQALSFLELDVVLRHVELLCYQILIIHSTAI